MLQTQRDPESLGEYFPPDAFTRLDESEDALFYEQDRFVEHLDSQALSTLQGLVGGLIVEERPAILDLMAGWDSHIPPDVKPSKVVGLGLNVRELAANPALTEYVIHDLNLDPVLPFPDASFDVVLNTVSVDYMTRPLEVFREVGRVLRPGGLFLVTFSNRMFPQKAIKLWRLASEEERVMYVEDLFRLCGYFESSKCFVSKGMPRPKEDRYAHLGIPSDPVYAVYADRVGGQPKERPSPRTPVLHSRNPEDVRRDMELVGVTLRCPYCGERMRKWTVPQTPFTEWDTEFMYICFNDACPYLVRGWQVMEEQGNRGMSYRCMYNPDRSRCMPVPVPTLGALKEGIVE